MGANVRLNACCTVRTVVQSGHFISVEICISSGVGLKFFPFLIFFLPTFFSFFFFFFLSPISNYFEPTCLFFVVLLAYDYGTFILHVYAYYSRGFYFDVPVRHQGRRSTLDLIQYYEFPNPFFFLLFFT